MLGFGCWIIGEIAKLDTLYTQILHQKKLMEVGRAEVPSVEGIAVSSLALPEN